jgi:hypothetical protein
MKKNSIVSFVCLLAAVAFMWACNREETNPQPLKTTIYSSSRAGDTKPQGTCTCGTKPNNCADFVNCLSKLIGSGNSKTFTINWKSCVNPDPSNKDCNGFGVQGTKSKATICYTPGANACNSVTCIISNPPDCLPCLPQTFCIQLGLQCNTAKNTFDLLGTDTNLATGIVYTVTISSDPKITVTCGLPGTSYNCTGELL